MLSKSEKQNFHQGLGLHEYYMGIFMATAYGMDESNKLEPSSLIFSFIWHLLVHQHVLYSMCAQDCGVGILLFHLEEKGFFIFFLKNLPCLYIPTTVPVSPLFYSWPLPISHPLLNGGKAFLGESIRSCTGVLNFNLINIFQSILRWWLQVVLILPIPHPDKGRGVFNSLM